MMRAPLLNDPDLPRPHLLNVTAEALLLLYHARSLERACRWARGRTARGPSSLETGSTVKPSPRAPSASRNCSWSSYAPPRSQRRRAAAPPRCRAAAPSCAAGARTGNRTAYTRRAVPPGDRRRASVAESSAGCEGS